MTFEKYWAQSLVGWPEGRVRLLKRVVYYLGYQPDSTARQMFDSGVAKEFTYSPKGRVQFVKHLTFGEFCWRLYMFRDYSQIEVEMLSEACASP